VTGFAGAGAAGTGAGATGTEAAPTGAGAGAGAGTGAGTAVGAVGVGRTVAGGLGVGADTDSTDANPVCPIPAAPGTSHMTDSTQYVRAAGMHVLRGPYGPRSIKRRASPRAAMLINVAAPDPPVRAWAAGCAWATWIMLEEKI
jgi:hypothetical protein